ncbi:hypothetical protein ACFKHW_28720 [Bradyrhizobium lupini]|uniref:hypothetical protein n=1 Tax=Rhizobium lupini TaxID=136996 RepID=UPI0036713360
MFGQDTLLVNRSEDLHKPIHRAEGMRAFVGSAKRLGLASANAVPHPPEIYRNPNWKFFDGAPPLSEILRRCIDSTEFTHTSALSRDCQQYKRLKYFPMLGQSGTSFGLTTHHDDRLSEGRWEGMEWRMMILSGFLHMAQHASAFD